jgi:ankyrin repeat protein
VTDNQNWKPLHYAAACEGAGPLKLLLSLGASVFDLNFSKQTALHIAAINGRTDNIKELLQA